MTLVEILVVLAIIAAVATIIYPAIIDSFKKTQATLVAQRLDAIQKAKAQYIIDIQTNTSQQNNYSSSGTPQIGDLSQYLIRLGQQVTTQAQLDEGTGGTINLGTWDGNAYFTANSSENNPYIAQYQIPSSDLKGGTASSTPTGAP
jgi:prepilin-type N-terminal cleavage/methylation domain-containing protein